MEKNSMAQGKTKHAKALVVVTEKEQREHYNKTIEKQKIFRLVELLDKVEPKVIYEKYGICETDPEFLFYKKMILADRSSELKPKGGWFARIFRRLF